METEQKSTLVIHLDSEEEEEVKIVSRRKRTFKERPLVEDDEFSKALSVPVVSKKSRSSGSASLRVDKETGSRGRSKGRAELSDGHLLGMSLNLEAKPDKKMNRERSPVPSMATRGESCAGSKRRGMCAYCSNYNTAQGIA